MIKVLITGSNGQVGRALLSALPPSGFDISDCDLPIVDIKRRSQIETIIDAYQPSIIIHCAAATGVDRCENDDDYASTNVFGTFNVLAAAQKINIDCFVYFSTDYIFNGKKETPYDDLEKEDFDPLGIYGQTKLAGELLTKGIFPDQALIIRTAGVFGEGNNFIKAILNKAKLEDQIEVVVDQIHRPTYALDLATMVVRLLQRNLKGVFHLTNDGPPCSWYQLASEIIRLRRLNTLVTPITTEEYMQKRHAKGLLTAKRPAYSVLSSHRLQTLGLKMRPWQEALKDYLFSMGELAD